MIKRKQPDKRSVITEEVVRDFVSAYLTNGGNGSAAVRTALGDPAKPSSASVTLAGRLKKHPMFRQAMADREASRASAVAAALQRYGIDVERAASEIARVAFSELRQVVDWYTTVDKKTGARTQTVRVKDATEIDPDAHRAIAKVTQRADGTVTIEMHDKLTALRDLARLKGWIADKPEGNTAAVSLIIQR